MSEDEARHRLEQAWKYASGEARRAFLIARYREQGATGESIIQIMGQVNAKDLSPGVQMDWEGRVVQWSADEAIRTAARILVKNSWMCRTGPLRPRQRFVHDPHPAHPTHNMGTRLLTKPLAPSLV